MPPGLSPDIQRQVLPDGQRFILPPRIVTPGNRKAAVVLYVISAVGVTLGVFWITGAIAMGAMAGGAMPKFFILILGLMGIPGIIAALMPAWFATLMVRGHSEIEITDSTLRATERAGLLHWSGSRPAASVRQFKVGHPMALRRQFDGLPPTAAGDEGMAAIQVLCDPGKPMLMAMGYPTQMLKSLADVIAAGVGVAVPSRVSAPAAPPVAVVKTVEEPDAGYQPLDEPVPDQPAGSRITLDRRGDGVTITVPPMGVKKGSSGLFGFGLAWTAFMVLFTVLWIFGKHTNGDKEGPIYVVMPLFWGIGAAMMLGGLNMGRRMAVIDIAADSLLLTHKSIFGVKQRQWRIDELADVLYGPSGMETNGRQVMHVRIVTHAGTTSGFFTGRADDELRWLAAVMRRELDLVGRARAAVDPRRTETDLLADPPRDSTLIVERRADGVTITALPRGVWRSGAFIFGMVWLSAVTAAIVCLLKFGVDDWREVPRVLIVVATVFWLVGLVTALTGAHLGRRRAIIDVVGDHLLVTRAGLFGTSQRDWAAADIAQVRCGDSGVKVNDVPLFQLQVVPLAGSREKLLTGRPRDELRWLAAVLSRELKLNPDEAKG